MRVRIGYKRNDYQVPSGLYAIGTPGADSHILVTANYKLSFDMLRQELQGINAWILVLDTLGINVWCAAGKGTFGTNELVGKLMLCNLKELVSHRTIILPQLGASGVSAHEVAKHTGFKVVYGPVRANDLPAFLKEGMKATEEMRTVQFGLSDRLALTPVELIHALKPLAYIFAALLLLNVIAKQPPIISLLFTKSLLNLIPYLGSVLIGCIIAPVFLPWIPGRPFALKGLLLGALWAAYVVMFPGKFALDAGNHLLLFSQALLLPAIASYLTLNFTGCTTFTSYSGVKREMKVALLPLIAAVSIGIIMVIAGKVIEFI